jgi:nitronate monooxygenase
VQVGTAYLFCPEAKTSELHRAALRTTSENATVLTNVFTGRPARGIINRAIVELGPLTTDAPTFPLAAGAITPLKTAAESKGSSDFSSLWSGQAARLSKDIPAGELTRKLAMDARQRLSTFAVS